MRMKKIVMVLFTSLICLQSHAQLECTKEMLIGRWRRVESTWTGMISNDSLRRIAEHSTKTLGHVLFSLDDTFTDTFQYDGRSFENTRQFRFDAMACELILGIEKRRIRENKVRRSKLEIIYIV